MLSLEGGGGMSYSAKWEGCDSSESPLLADCESTAGLWSGLASYMLWWEPPSVLSWNINYVI